MLKYVLPLLLAFSVNTFAEDLVGGPGAPKEGVKQEKPEGKPGKGEGLTKAEWMARAAARFEELDTNKDGKVTREEEKAGFEKMRGEHKKKGGEGGPGGPKKEN